MTQKIQSTHKWLIIFIIALPAIMYTVWLSHFYSGDDLQYAMLVESSTSGKTFYHPLGERVYEPGYLERTSIESSRLPINPRYLLEYPTSIAVVKIWQAFGYTGLAILPVLLFRVLIGSAGLIFLTLAILRFTGRPALAALGCLGVAFSLAYWTYSTHLDQSINMIAIFALVLFLLARQHHKTGYFDTATVAIPILMSLATLYNFTAVIISGTISLVIVLTDPRLTWKNRLLRFLRYNLIYAVVLMVILVGAIALGAGPQNLINPAYWASVTFSGHPEYTVNLARDLFRAAIGFMKSQISFPGAAGAFQAFWDQASGNQKIALLAYYGVAGLIFSLPLIYLAIKRSRASASVQRHIEPLWLLGAIFLTYSLFNLFWDPGYIKYWTVPLICWWLFAVIVIAEIQITRPNLGKFAVALAALFILISTAINLVSIIGRESRFNPNPWLEMSAKLQNTPPNALFISKGSGLDFYVAYFTRRNLISLDLISYAKNADEKVIGKILTEQVHSHLNDNGPIYVFGFDESDTTRIDQILTLAEAEKLEPAFAFDDLTIYRAVR